MAERTSYVDQEEERAHTKHTRDRTSERRQQRQSAVVHNRGEREAEDFQLNTN